MSETEDAKAKSAFAKWKFDTIELLNIGLAAREFRVAVCLIGYMNWKTRLVYPAQATVAVMLGMDLSAVRRAIRKMVEMKLLEVDRHNPAPSPLFI